MSHIDFFWLLLVICCGVALVLGGHSERATAITFVIGALLSRIAYLASIDPWGHIDPARLGIDAAMLVILTAIALRSERYWPLWMAALQADTVLCHFTRLLPNLFGMAYAVALSLWAYIMLPLLLVGSIRHRLRMRRSGIDKT